MPGKATIQPTVWFPKDRHAWQQPGTRVILAGVGGFEVCLWSASQFLQLRGYVNLTASRVPLAMLAAGALAPLLTLAFNLPSRRKLWATLFVLGVASLAIAIDRVTLPPPKVAPVAAPVTLREVPLSMGTLYFRKDYSLLENGRELQLNSFFTNHGNEDLHNAVSLTSVIGIDSRTAANLDQAALEFFKPQLVRAKADYYSGRKAGTVVAPGANIWGTARIVLNEREIEGLKDGSYRMYVFGWMASSNFSDRIDCAWLQQPERTLKLFPPESLVWHHCMLGL